MSQKKIEARLREMLNKTFIYRDKKAIIKKSQQEGSLYLLYVEIDGVASQYEKTLNELDLFLLNFRPVPIIEPPKEVAVIKKENKSIIKHGASLEPEFITKHREIFSKLTDKLLEDIDKVREDPEYIKQAKQVTNLSNAVISIAKLELDSHVKINSL